MRGRLIEHRGIVEQVMSHAITVSIMQETACSACAAAQLCRSSEKKEKRMEVACDDASSYKVGQEVVIVGDIGLGMRATLWAYAVPLVLLMAVLIIVGSQTGREGIAALAALLSLLLYYMVLYMFRDKLQRRFTFKIKS